MRSISCRRLAPLSLLLVVVACGAPAATTEPPRVVAVQPARGHDGQATDIAIHGERFSVAATHRHGAGAEVDATFRAWLGDRELEAVRWVDGKTLAGRVPAGLPRGHHPLRIVGPGGEARLDGAYEVVAGVGARIALSASASPAQVAVGKQVTVTVRVTNDGDAPAELGGAMTASGPVEDERAPLEPVRVEAGATAELTWKWRATGAGVATFAAVVDGSDVETGAALRATGQATVEVLAVASGGWWDDPWFLSLRTLAIAPAAVEKGKEFDVVLEVHNDGSTPAPLQPSILFAGVEMDERESPSSGVVAAGGVARFTWTVRADDPGTVTLVLRGRVTGLQWVDAYVTATAQVRIFDE